MARGQQAPGALTLPASPGWGWRRARQRCRARPPRAGASSWGCGSSGALAPPPPCAAPAAPRWTPAGGGARVCVCVCVRTACRRGEQQGTPRLVAFVCVGGWAGGEAHGPTAQEAQAAMCGGGPGEGGRRRSATPGGGRAKRAARVRPSPAPPTCWMHASRVASMPQLQWMALSLAHVHSSPCRTAASRSAGAGGRHGRRRRWPPRAQAPQAAAPRMRRGGPRRNARCVTCATAAPTRVAGVDHRLVQLQKGVGQHDGDVALPLLAEHPQPLGGRPSGQHLHELATPGRGHGGGGERVGENKVDI